MKTFDQLREGFVSAAQRKAVWASKADGGKGHPDNKKEDSDAVKAFLAKGGKIKKLPPAKAQGYHGKDDPGKDMHGMLDKPDTKKIGTRKKVKSMEGVEENYQVNESIADHEDAANAHQMAANSAKQDLRAKKAHMSAASHHMDAIKHLNKGDRASAAMSHRAAKSQSKIARRHGNKISHSAHADTHAIRTESYMEATQVDEISKDTKKSYIKKAVGDIDNRSFAQGLRDKNPTYTSADSKNNRKIANRRKGIDRALEAKETDPPFDKAKPIQKDTKDKFGNLIKNRAKHLARKAARDLLNKAK